MLLIRRLTVSIALVLALGAAVATAEPPGKITLERGRNVLTWTGPEPYLISDLQGTPVTQIHRWDPATQQWLSHFMGQEEATLPELHLLPRVQYLLVAESSYEIAISDPLAGVEPGGALNTPGPTDAPLSFNAFWPNEDSPLDDLVVLRGADQRLSVRARTSGGVGDVSVWWVIDGRLNHVGLTSNSVDLTPGAHDQGRVYAVDDAGQVAVVRLPRIVRLPDIELPAMTYGVVAHVGSHWHKPYSTGEKIEAAARLIDHAGLTVVRVAVHLETPQWHNQGGPWLDPSATRVRLEPLISRGIAVMAQHTPGPYYATVWDLDRVDETEFVDRPQWATPPNDPLAAQAEARLLARELLEVLYHDPLHEPNHTFYNAAIDPWTSAAMFKARALGIWYENPSAIVFGPEVGCSRANSDGPMDEYGYSMRTSCGEGIVADAYLQAMYDAGFGKYFDVGTHTHYHTQVANVLQSVDLYREVMALNGDAAKPMWLTESGWFTSTGNSDEVTTAVQAELIVNIMRALAERTDVTGQLVYNFQNGPDPGYHEDNFGIVFHGLRDGTFVPKPAYWAIREYLTGQPPPLDE